VNPLLKNKLTALIVLVLSFAASMASSSKCSAEIPERPEKLVFADRNFTPPDPAQYRHVLSSGAVVFIAEDHDIPLVDISVTVRTGQYLDPAGKDGLAGLTGSQMRTGGTTSTKAEAFDEEADFLAASISSGIGDTQGGASAGCLSKDVDRVLDLYFDMLRNPAFQQDRLDLAKAQELEGMKRRNDSTTSIEAREWNRLMRGKEHFSSKMSTSATLGAITRDDLIAFHKKYYHPNRFIFSVAGDFRTDEMLANIEKHLAGWEAAIEDVPPIPKPDITPKTGLYFVNKDVNQGRISIGHLGTTRENPDRYALLVMNNILGGGGFTSRIMSRVRSDEGLAYSAGSRFDLGVYYDGVFRAAFQSKSPSCAQAIKIVLDEINKMRTEKVTDSELKTAINAVAESLPRQFSNARTIVNTFADDEYTHRDPNYWKEFQAGVRGVTADAVLGASQKYLHPDSLTMMAVGNVAAIRKGNPDKPDFRVDDYAPGGAINTIPLPDPLTLVYPITF